MQIVPFQYSDKTVRTITDKNNEPWFVAKDVCSILGISDTSDAVSRLDEDERGLTPIVDTLGRKQDGLIISESGLYALIIRSDKPEARKFRKWVTSEVLPSIRKTGNYLNKSAQANQISDFRFRFEMLYDWATQKRPYAFTRDQFARTLLGTQMNPKVVQLLLQENLCSIESVELDGSEHKFLKLEGF